RRSSPRGVDPNPPRLQRRQPRPHPSLPPRPPGQPAGRRASAPPTSRARPVSDCAYSVSPDRRALPPPQPLGFLNLSRKRSVLPFRANTLSVCLSSALCSTWLSPTYLKPALVTSCLTSSGSIRCSVSVSRAPDPVSAT